MSTSGPSAGPAAQVLPHLPDGDHPVTRPSDLAMFGWTMDADRPDATARNLHTGLHVGYAFVPAVTTGPHSTTEDVDNVTTIDDRALDEDGARLPSRAR